MRSIQKEIGDGDDSSDLGELRRRVEEAGMPEGARRETERELGRLAAIQPAPPRARHGAHLRSGWRTYLGASSAAARSMSGALARCWTTITMTRKR